MAHKKLMATAELFLNTKNAKKDAQVFIDDLKQKLADIETAADKMTVFKDMVGYIAQVDKALSALKANNKDAFNSMFDGLDINLKKQLEGIFGIDGVKLGQLDVLRDTLNNLTTKASIKEIREFAKSLNEIYEGVGLKTPFADIENEFKEFNKEAKAKHIEKLTSQLANFATVWKDVNAQIAKGFGVGGSGFGSISGLSQEVQSEIDILKKQAEEIKNIVDVINNPKKVKVTLAQQSENQVEQLKNLKDAFISASVAKQQLETNQMTGTPEYLNSVAKYVQAAAELKSAFESTKLTKAGNEWIMSSGLGVLQDADNVLDKFFVQNKDLMDKVVNMYTGKIHNIGAQISFLEKPYDTLKSKMEEYADLQNKMNHEERFSEDEINAIDAKIQELEKYLFALDQVGDKKNDIQKILTSVTFDGMGGLAAAEEFCKLLGVEIPKAAQKAEDVLKAVGGSNSGIVTTGVAHSGDNITEDVKETVSAIDYAKKELTKAWQEYYRVAQQAADDYGLIIEDGETSPEMDKIKASIDKKIDSWGVVATNPSKWGVKVDLDLADAIADGDIDAGGIEKEIDKLIKQHGITFNIPIEDMTGDANKSLDDMSGDIGQTTDALNNAESQVVDTQTAFQNLVNYISQSGDKPAKFFDKLESGAQSVDDELNSILQSLNLIDSSGNINLSSIKSGFTNKGGFVSDQYTMIARRITGQYGQDYLGKSEKLQAQLASAKQAGAQIGAIFDLIKDEAHGLFYEIQNTVPGEAAFSHHKMDVNADVLKASKDQLSDLVHTMKALSDNGLFIDFGGDNILYDKDKGFSIIDLGLVGDQYHTVSSQNTLQENLDRFIKEYFKFAPSSMHADIQTMLADTLYDIAHGVDANIINPNGLSKQQIDSNKRIIAATKAEESAHEQNADAIDEEKAALEALIQLKTKAQNMKWKDFAKDESLAGLKDIAGFTSISQLEKFWKQARYDKKIDFHEISESEAHKIFNNKLTPGLASQWYGPQKFPVKDQLENEILQDDEVRNAALSYMYHLYKNWLPSTYKNPNVNSFEDFLNTEFTLYRGDDSPLVYGDESKMSFSFSKEKAENFSSNIGTVKVKPKDTIGNAGSHIESEVEIFGMKSADTSWFKETNETFEDFYNKQTKEMQDEINAGLVNLEKRRIQDLLDENISKLTHKAGKDTNFQNGALKQFQQGSIPDSLDVVGDGTIADQFAAAYNGLSDIDKKLVAYYANLEAISNTLPDQFSISQYGTESSKKMVGEDAKLFNAVLNDPTGVQKHVANLTGESKFGILGQNAQGINLEANMHKMNTQAIEEEKQAQQGLNREKDKAWQMFSGVSDKLHKDAENKDDPVVQDISDVWDGVNNIYKTIDGPYADPNLIDIGGYLNQATGEIEKVKDFIDKLNSVAANTGIDLSYVQDYISEIYKNADLDGIDKAFNGVMSVDPKSDYDIVSDNLKRLVDSKQAGSEEFNMLAHVWHQLKHVDWTAQNGALEDDINNGKYYSTFNGEFKDVSELYAFIDEIKQKWGTNLIEVKDYLNKVFAKYNQNQQEGYRLDEDLILDLDDFDLDDINDQPVDNIAAYNNAFNQALSEYASATGKKEEKLNKLIEYLKEVQVTEQESIDDGEIQLGVEGETAKIEDVYALVDEIQNKHSTDLSDVKYYLDQVFEEYNKKTATAQTELSPTASADKIDYWGVKDKLFDEVFAIHDEDADEKLKTLLSNLSDVNLSSQDLIDDGKVEDLLNDSSYDIEQVYGLVECIQKQYGINLEYVKDYLNQVYEAYNNKIDRELLEPSVDDDLPTNEYGETLAFQSKRYSVEDYENAYKSQSSNAQNAIKDMATFYQKYTNLQGKMFADDPIDFLISPDNAIPSEIAEVQQTLEAFKAKKQEIANLPIVKTEDDVEKLQELQAEAINLQNKLSSVKLSKYNPQGYDEAFNLSYDDAVLLNDLVNGPDVYDLYKNLSAEYNTKTDKMYDATSDEFNAMIADDASNSLNDYLLKLGEELKLEQQITAEKEQQKELQDQLEDAAKKDENVKVEQSPKLDTGAGKIVGGDYALESTLQQTNSILGNILTATQTEGSKGSIEAQKPQEPKQIQDATPEDPFKKNLYNQTHSFNKYRKDLENVEYVSRSLRDELDKLGTELHQVTTQGDLTGWAKKFNDLKDNIKVAKSVFEQENFGKINLYQKELTNSFNKLTFPQRKGLFDKYSEALILLNKQKQEVKEGHAVELAGLEQITAALQEKINKQIEANQIAKDAAKSQKKNSKFGDTAMINATAKHNRLSQISKSDQFVNSSEISKALEAYDQAYTKMQNIRNDLNNQADITTDDKEKFKVATTECNEYAKALDKLIKNSLKLHNEKVNPDDYMLGSDFIDDANGRKEALANFAKEMYGVSLSAEDFKKNFNEAVFAVDNGDGTFTKMTAKFTDARNEIVAMAGDTKKVQGAFGAFFDELKGKFKSIGAYLIASFSFHEVWSVIRQGVQYVREIDSALTELKKVTDETDASYRSFLQDMSKTGAVIGATVKDLTSSAADWARLGSIVKSAPLCSDT